MCKRSRGIVLSACLGLCLGLAACSSESGIPAADTDEEAAGETEQPASEPERETEPEASAPDMSSAADQANDFAQRFYGEVASGQSGNLFFSPLSIHAALSMTYAGARGATADQMQQVLAFEHGPEEAVEHAAYSELLEALNTPPIIEVESIEGRERKMVERPVFDLIVANRLWGQEGFEWNPEYLRLTEREYLAGLAQVDFEGNTEAARNTINSWVEETTRDRIRNLIPQGGLTVETRLVLTNAIYFKANWADTFEERNTKPEPFHLQGGETVDVPMMHQAETFGYAQGGGWQALAMPYEKGVLSMIVVLPADREGALAAVEQQLLSGDLLAQLSSLQRPKVQVWLPKFSMTLELELGSGLSAMGMPLAFSRDADFSGMAPDADLFISKALHKAFVEVDEKGTEAAAATAVVIGLTSAPVEPEQPKLFRADRPFIFLIRHNPSGAILFLGRVMDPR